MGLPSVTRPCKDCQDRHPGCHGGCDRYKAFCEENERIRKARHEYCEMWAERASTKRYKRDELMKKKSGYK